MKKIFKYWSILLLVFLFTNCLTLSETVFPERECITETKSETNKGFASVNILSTWYNKDNILYNQGFMNFNLTVKNTTDKIIKIIWEQSSISYDSNSYSLFITGQKYIDANTPMPPSIIPPNGNLEKDLYSANQVDYANSVGWITQRINADKVTILLCIECDGVQEYFITHITSVEK